jgi:hypothetical protein
LPAQSVQEARLHSGGPFLLSDSLVADMSLLCLVVAGTRSLGSRFVISSLHSAPKVPFVPQSDKVCFLRYKESLARIFARIPRREGIATEFRLSYEELHRNRSARSRWSDISRASHTRRMRTRRSRVLWERHIWTIERGGQINHSCKCTDGQF